MQSFPTNSMYSDQNRPALAGKTAVITGAARGIGAAIALAMAQAGANVVINYRKSQSAAERIKSQCQEFGSNAVAVQGDITDSRQVEHLMNAATQLGLPSILVNNAGTSLYRMFEDTNQVDFEKAISTNLMGPFLCTKAALPYLKRHPAGRIINISSIWGVSGAAGESVYAAAKGGLIALTKSLAKELGSTGITVNTIAPGAIATDMLGDLTAEDRMAVRRETPLGRIGNPEDIAHAAVFLASDNAAYITGEVLRIDGGFSH